MTEQTQDDILAAFQDLPLPDRLPVYADGLAEVSEHLGNHPCSAYTPQDLHALANRFKREDAERAREAQEVEELARLMYQAKWAGSSVAGSSAAYREQWRDAARSVLAAGYRKTDQ